MKYSSGRKKRLGRLPHRVWVLLIVLVIVIIGGTIAAQVIFTAELRPYSINQKTQIFTVANGSSVKQIADNLKSDHLIRSSWALQLYVHSKNLTNQLQAGTYDFSPSESTSHIVVTMVKGSVTSRLVTILPGRRIDQVKADLINDGFSPASVNSALNPALYSNLPVLAFKPPNVDTLEGLLWPDSFEKEANTAPSVIIEESLNEMAQHLTSQVQAEFAAEGLTTYQGLTLTSIVEQEVSKASDQTQVAQVFLSRLKNNMSLGSDVTANYGAIEAGKAPSLTYNSPYNTLIHTGLPPGPISTISLSALQATTHPAATNWLYFVAGDDGTTYFATTLAQQQANTAKYCHKLCAEQ
jgi:UPF0755 protein